MTAMSGLGCASAPVGVALTLPSQASFSRRYRAQAVEAALPAERQAARTQETARPAVERELEEARYAAELAERRYEHVDPAKRHVARTLEARWNTALERVTGIEQKLERMGAEIRTNSRVDPAILKQLASELPFAWNAAGTDARARQRLVRLLLEEVVIDIDETTNEFVLLLHWIGGCHTEVRLARRKTGRYPPGPERDAARVLRKLGGHWPDRELAVTLNRMRCRNEDGETWTTVRVAALRDRLAIPAYDPDAENPKTISVDAAAKRLGYLRCLGPQADTLWRSPSDPDHVLGTMENIGRRAGQRGR